MRAEKSLPIILLLKVLLLFLFLLVTPKTLKHKMRSIIVTIFLAIENSLDVFLNNHQIIMWAILCD